MPAALAAMLDGVAAAGVFEMGVAETGVAERGAGFAGAGGTKVDDESRTGVVVDDAEFAAAGGVSPGAQPAGGSTITMLPHLGQARI
jgi:hypothetical protein